MGAEKPGMRVRFSRVHPTSEDSTTNQDPKNKGKGQVKKWLHIRYYPLRICWEKRINNIYVFFLQLKKMLVGAILIGIGRLSFSMLVELIIELNGKLSTSFQKVAFRI